MRNLLDRFTWHSLGSSTEVVLHWRGQQRWVPQHCKSANCVMRVWVWFLATWVPVVEEDSLSGHTLNALDCSCASGKFYHGAHAFPLWRYPYTKILSPTVYFLYCSTNTQSFMLSYQILVLLKRWSKKRDKRIRSSQSTSATWLEERKTLKPHLELKPSIFLLVFWIGSYYAVPSGLRLNLPSAFWVLGLQVCSCMRFSSCFAEENTMGCDGNIEECFMVIYVVDHFHSGCLLFCCCLFLRPVLYVALAILALAISGLILSRTASAS